MHLLISLRLLYLCGEWYVETHNQYAEMGAYKHCLLVEWFLPGRTQVITCTRMGTTGHTVSSLIRVDFPAPLGPNNILSAEF